jgi:hypothetical protein
MSVDDPKMKSLKALDRNRPIREADMGRLTGARSSATPHPDILSHLSLMLSRDMLPLELPAGSAEFPVGRCGSGCAVGRPI